MKLDETNKTVSSLMERKLYDLTAGTQGNMQLLSNGNAMMGWGQQPFFSEYSKTGKLLLSVRYPDPDESYRVYRYAWKGHPTGRPSVAALPTGARTGERRCARRAGLSAGSRLSAASSPRAPSPPYCAAPGINGISRSPAGGAWFTPASASAAIASSVKATSS